MNASNPRVETPWLPVAVPDGTKASVTSRWILVLGWIFLVAIPASAELTVQEERGKAIYLRGVSASGEKIMALMGETEVEVPASVIPCGSCHGRDGRGRPEGGISPSNLTWQALTKPYGLDHPSGRQHPPYTERALKRAFTMGIDPAGNRLHVAMPRYRLTLQDAEDLVAYIRRLGEDLDPGLTEDSIAVATMIPRQGPAASLGEAVETVLRARFEELNRRGGIYHRRVELKVVDAPHEPTARAEALRRWLEAGETFAVVGAFLSGAEEEAAAVFGELETPLVGPLASDPHLDFFASNPWVFYLLPGLEDLGFALVRFADHQATGQPLRTAIVHDGTESTAASAEQIAAFVTDLGWPPARTAGFGFEAGVVPALREADVDLVVLLLSGDRQATFLEDAAAADWFPRILLPGALAGSAVFTVPSGFDRRIFLAFPTLPQDRDPRDLAAYRELSERHDLGDRHAVAQIAALAAAEILIEGMKRTGRELSRGGLVAALEQVVDLETGLVPPVTYGPNRRIGVRGARVSMVDLKRQTLLPASGWIESGSR